jgi:hypothetical protein
LLSKVAPAFKLYQTAAQGIVALFLKFKEISTIFSQAVYEKNTPCKNISVILILMKKVKKICGACSQ